MRIGIVSLETFRYQCTHPLDMATVLVETGHEVTVFAPFFDPDRYGERAFHAVVIPSPGSRGILSGVAWTTQIVRTLLKDGHFDVIVGVNAPGYAVAHVCRRLGGASALAYYAMELSLPDDANGRWSASIRYQGRFARDADLVVSTGDERAQIMVERLRLKRRPVVVPNAPLEAVRHGSLLRERLGADLHPGAKHIAVYTGALAELNAIDQLIEAVALWRDDTALALIGFGSDDTLARMRSAAARSSGRICYIGPLEGDHRTLLQYTSGADIGIALMLQREPSLNVKYWTPTKLFDYMACGLPVVCSSNPSLAFVEQEGWGVLVEAEDPMSIARGVDWAITHRSGMSDRARALFAEKYNYRVGSRDVVHWLANEQRCRSGANPVAVSA